MEALLQETPARQVDPSAESDQRRLGLALMVLAALAAGALILWLERGTTYMSDEWAWLGYASEGSLVDMLRPLNQHLTLIPLLITKASLGIWGTSIAPFAIVQVAGVLACGGAVYAFARPRVGPLVALAPAMVPMFLGTGSVILLDPLIGLQVVYSLAFGVGALIAFDRGSRGGDIAAAVLTCLSLASFSTGIAFLAGLAVAVALSPDWRRRSIAFLIPFVLYGAWRLWAMKFGATGGPQLANVPAVPFYWVDSLALTTSALFGRSGILAPGPGTYLFVHGFALPQAAATLAIATIEVAVIYVLARSLARSGPIPAMLWATVVIVLTLWTSQGLVLVDGRTPGEPRYIYPGAIALALLASEAARRVRFSRRGVAIVLAVTLIGIVGNLPRFKEGRDAIAYHAPRNLSYIGLMDLAGANADPLFYPAADTPVASPAGALSVSVQGYQELSSRYGGFGYSPAQILEQSDEIRHGSDEVAIGMLHLAPTPAGAERGRNCIAVTDTEAELPRGGAILRAAEPTPISLRRFSAEGGVKIGQLQAGEPTLLRIPPDSTKLPWILETPVPGSLSVCAVATTGA